MIRLLQEVDLACFFAAMLRRFYSEHVPGLFHWRNNIIQDRTGDDNTLYTTADNAKYAWPTDNKSHTTDFAN